MDATSERLVDYTLQARFEDLTPAIIGECKIRVLDTLGCVASAYDHPVSVSARKFAARYSMDTPVTMFGTGQQVSPEMGAFANSVMLRASDMKVADIQAISSAPCLQARNWERATVNLF